MKYIFILFALSTCNPAPIQPPKQPTIKKNYPIVMIFETDSYILTIRTDLTDSIRDTVIKDKVGIDTSKMYDF